MKKIPFFILLALIVIFGAVNTVYTFPQLKNDFLTKPFFYAFYNNIGVVLSGPAILLAGVIIAAIFIWIKLGKRDED